MKCKNINPNSDEPHNFYSSPNIIRMIKSTRMRLAGHVTRMGEKRNAYWWESQKERDHWEDQVVGKVDNIKMDRREIGWYGVDWIYMAQDRDHWRALVNTVMKTFGFHKMLE
jgi:hypothetical protein